GTEVRATLRNSLTVPLTVYGFGERRGLTDSVIIAPGEVKPVHFLATTPGTYFYAGKTIPGPVVARLNDDSQLNGAIIVDAAGASPAPPDRVFLISWWYTLDSTSASGLGHGTMSINGRSWPHTERLSVTQGDSAHWRVINLTGQDHPMHLHGVYFAVDAKGDGTRDTAYSADERRLAVTEVVDPGKTMALSWSPKRPGNWVFHCHYAGHISYLTSLETERGVRAPMAPHDAHAATAQHRMSGLVMGINVKAREGVVRSTRAPRPIRLLVQSKPGVYGAYPGYGYAIDDGGRASDSLTVPGPALVLERDQPVAVTIVNKSHEPAAVHWHGIELESYPDGVPGWSGQRRFLRGQILPSIPVGDSLTVRFTPPRAGTFMYHSHFNEMDQISSGAYGPIIVLEPGQHFDKDTDRIFMFSEGGPTTNVIAGPFPPHFLNGKAKPDPINLRAGKTYRFRMIAITSDIFEEVALLDDASPVEWRLVAKDGADTRANQRTMRPAKLRFDPGEIYDFEFTPRTPGNLKLIFGADTARTTVAVRVQ
ncbi:MAG TPA: multicopper oxidase domain-containing protein, partial [Gemmatimonadaceae bacterium]|nr:multicopper oxidase domain-containing protein [Gemmatimonadaceae bacterium]